jgi:hypothetical protein
MQLTSVDPLLSLERGDGQGVDHDAASVEAGSAGVPKRSSADNPGSNWRRYASARKRSPDGGENYVFHRVTVSGATPIPTATSFCVRALAAQIRSSAAPNPVIDRAIKCESTHA